MLNILLVVVPTLGELEQGWSLGLRFAQVNELPPKRQNTKQNEAPPNHVWLFWTSWSRLLETFRSSPIFAVSTAIPDSAPHIVPLQCSWGCLTLGQQPVTSSGWFGTQEFPLMPLGPGHGPLDALFSTLAHQSGAASKMLHWDCSSSIISIISAQSLFSVQKHW